MVNKLQIVRVDNLAVQRIDLQTGDNIIGRGAATGNVDNPSIAEQAVTLHLAPTGQMTMTPMSTCYMKSCGSPRWQSLRVGSTISIHPGDICSLLPDKSWFKVTFNNSTTTMDEDSNGKRKARNSTEEEPPDKKLRAGESVETIYSQSKSFLDNWDNEGGAATVVDKDNHRTLQCTASSNITIDHSNSMDDPSPSVNNENSPIPDNSIDDVDKTVDNDRSSTNPLIRENDSSASKESPSSNRDEAGKKIKWDCAQHFSDQTNQGNSETPVGENGQETSPRREENPTGESTVAPDEPPRIKCTYGSRCYRRNSDHRRQFAHPGDPDYDIPDTRSECPYGVRCYRKNPQHKRDFKHTTNRPSRAQTPVRSPMSDATSGTEQSSAEESIDESDYEPSYYDGATSDEYRSDLDGLSDYEALSDCDDK